MGAVIVQDGGYQRAWKVMGVPYGPGPWELENVMEVWSVRVNGHLAKARR